MREVRYGFYLRPSAAMCRAQAEIHDLLERQYGLRAAGKFMPHATIKGFFKSDAPVAEMIERLDGVLCGRPAFPVYNAGVLAWERGGIVLSVQEMPDGRTNDAMQALHEAAFEAILPLVADDCTFTGKEWARERFHAHLTLAMADIPEPFFAEIVDFVNELGPIGPSVFPAEAFHLFRFESDDWQGNWWETLTWTLLHGWRLEQPGGGA
jgi:2'-5' RNA ligase